MGFSDTVAGLVDRFKPSNKSTSFSGIGSGNQGIVSFEDDMIVSKPMIVFRASQTFFDFIAMACFASVASFQAKWNVGPSGLSGFAIFVSVTSIVLSLLMVLVPVLYEKYDKLARLSRALREVRVGFILNGGGTVLNLLIAFITTISAWTQPGCKDASQDPHAKDRDDGFKNGLPDWCNTKRAGAIFFWLASIFWIASFVLTVMDWRSGKSLRPRDPPFTRPAEVDDDYDDAADEESAYNRPVGHRDSTIDQARPEPNNYSSTAPSIPPISIPDSSTPVHHSGEYTSPTSRPSMDVYGAFSDPVPSGYSNPYSPPEPNRVSRTMQYADPYAAVRASITPQQQAPPSYGHDDRY